MGCNFLLQLIFPTQGLNPGLPHCRWILYQLSYQGSPATRASYQIRIESQKKEENALFYTLSQPALFIFHIIILSSEQDSSLSQSRKDILGTVVAGGLGPPILSKNRASQGVRPTYTQLSFVVQEMMIL